MSAAPDDWSERDQQRLDEDREYIEAVLDGDDEWDYDEKPVIDGNEAAALADADDHIRAMRFHRGRLTQAEEVAASSIARATERAEAKAKAYLAAMYARHEHRAEWHEAHLENLHIALLARDPKRTSIPLPSGVLRSKKQPEKVTYDNAVTLAWLRTNMPGLVRVTERVERSVIKADLDAAVKAGVEIPGVATEHAYTKFWIDDPINPEEQP